MDGLAAWRRAERGVDRFFGAPANPLRQPGTLAILALVLLVASGLWLYAVLDTSADRAYASIDALAPYSPGGLLRSLHRYAADALVLFTTLHALRELLHRRWRAVHRFAWLTGVVLLPLLAAIGIGGFWLHWDRLGQFSALATAEWFDALPALAQPLARNFLDAASVGDRLFSLFVFMHLGLPLLLLFALWFHVQRLSQVAWWPPRSLALGTTGSLLALALAWPVRGQGPAELATVPASLAFDWWLLWLHPVADALSPAAAWALVGAGLGVLFTLPWLRRGPARAPAAVVDPAHCNGCRRCVADCPYAAITLVPHPLRPSRVLAQVDADLCASCGLCAGACPSSVPRRGGAPIATGIDLPQRPIAALQDALRAVLDRQPGLVVFACAHAAVPAGADVLTLECSGQLPPSFVDQALREGAGGVAIVHCRDCVWRLGVRWTAERLAGRRPPRLASRVPRERLCLVPADAGEDAQAAAAIAAFKEKLLQIKAPT